MAAIDQILCRTSEQASAAACAKAQGWPAGPAIYSGAGTPEGSWYGFWPGDQYMDTETGTQYGFNGTPGENTGWEALN